MLGNVSCGPDATGSMALSNVLNETVAAFSSLGLSTRVQVPTTEWYVLRLRWRCDAEPIARSRLLALVSVDCSPA